MGKARALSQSGEKCLPGPRSFPQNEPLAQKPEVDVSAFLFLSQKATPLNELHGLGLQTGLECGHCQQGRAEALTATAFRDCRALDVHQVCCGEGSFQGTCQVKSLQSPMVRPGKKITPGFRQKPDSSIGSSPADVQD